MSLRVQTLFHNELLPRLTALKTSQISQSKPEVEPWEGGGGGGGNCHIWGIELLGMCLCEGYGFQAIYHIYSINHPGRLLNFWTLRVGAYSRLGAY